MPKKNNQSEEYSATTLNMWEFKWTVFNSEEYDNDQKFLFIFGNGDELIMEYGDFMDCNHLTRIGCTHYLPINLRGVK